MTAARGSAVRSRAPLLWSLLAVLAIGGVLLVDPLGFVAPAKPGLPPAATAAPDEGGASAAPVTAPLPLVPSAAPADRQAIDPLASLARFRVVLRPGRPVADAQLLLLRHGNVLADLRTDGNGEAARAADGQPVFAFVAVANRVLETRDLVLDAGVHELLLEPGACVAGRFQHADGSPAGDLELSVDSDQQPFVGDALPRHFVAALRRDCLVQRRTLVRTAADGSIELGGLPAHWRGRLEPQGPVRVTATTSGTLEPDGRGIRLPEPASGFVVTLAPRPLLRGRLLLRDDGEPLAKVELSARLQSTEGSLGTNATTDADGRFTFEPRGARVDGIEVWLGLGRRQLPPIVALEGAQVPADGDLGDIAVDGLRHVPFALRDADGAPVARGVASAAGVRSDRTGADGNGELAFVPRAAKELEGEAPGFVPTSAPMPASVLAPIVLVLQRGNELRVTVRLPKDANVGQFKVVLRGPPPITAAPVASVREQQRHVSPWAFDAANMNPDALSGSLCGNPDHMGVVSFRALRAGIELELTVGGITGTMVYHQQVVAPLAASERRDVTVDLERGMFAFRGRVLDRDGAPLSSAALQLGNQILGFTDAQGAFACWLASPQTGTLLVQHRSCATLRLGDYAVPLDGLPVEFRLAPARPLTIEVVDADGAPVPQAEVFTRFGGFITNTNRIEGNRHLASSMPDQPFEIVAFLVGREFAMQHDPALATARLVVPVLGRVAALVDDASTAGRAGEFVLVLTPTTGAAWQPSSVRRAASAGLRIEMAAVPPGSYQVTLRYVPDAAERAAGGEELLAAAVGVVVESGREAEVRLALPPRRGG